MQKLTLLIKAECERLLSEESPELRNAEGGQKDETEALVQLELEVFSDNSEFNALKQDSVTTRSTNSALTHCPDCKSMVSKLAITCPHCGRPLVGVRPQSTGKSDINSPNDIGIGLNLNDAVNLKSMGFGLFLGGIVFAGVCSTGVDVSRGYAVGEIVSVLTAVLGFILLVVGIAIKK